MPALTPTARPDGSDFRYNSEGARPPSRCRERASVLVAGGRPCTRDGWVGMPRTEAVLLCRSSTRGPLGRVGLRSAVAAGKEEIGVATVADARVYRLYSGMWSRRRGGGENAFHIPRERLLSVKTYSRPLLFRARPREKYTSRVEGFRQELATCRPQPSYKGPMHACSILCPSCIVG